MADDLRSQGKTELEIHQTVNNSVRGFLNNFNPNYPRVDLGEPSF
jgi:hypothetical protein